MNNSRLIWADSLKGWLILLVILGHAIQSTLGADCDSNHVWNLIYSFHMPAFMAVSGWLTFRSINAYKSAKHNWGGYLSGCKRRSYQLLMPYLVWTFVSFLMKGEYTLQHVGEILLYPDRSFWFLWVLFWICVIFKLAQLIASKLKMNEMVLILGACLLLLGLMVAMEIRVLGFQFLAYYFLFYTLGYCLHKYGDTALLKGLSKPLALVALTILWAFLAWGWTMHGIPSWIPAIPPVPSALLQYAYRGLTALVAIVVLIDAAPMLLNGTDEINKAICTLGVVSLGLYVVHLSIIGYVVTGIRSVIPSIRTWSCAALAFAVALVISYLVVWLLSKNKHTARVFLGNL